MNVVQRAYRYRFYPTAEQETILSQTFGCARFVYNHFLRARTDAFYQEQRRIGYNETAKLLTKLKQQPDMAFLQEVSNVVLQQSLRNLDAAFKNFLQGRAQYPTFKKKHGKQSVRYTRSGFRWKDGQIYLAKMDEPLNIRWSRSFKGEPSSVTVSKDTVGRYFISILVEEEIKPLPVVNKMVGIDLGLKDAVILSEEEKIPNPSYLRKAERKLARAQRRLAKKQKGSKNRAKARLKVARLHAKIADSRKDWAHKLTSRLVNENQVLAVESLQVKNMVKNPNLAKAISDVGWADITRLLEYKANWYGRTFVQIDKFYPSSKRCSTCGHILDTLTLDVRSWTCPECGAEHCRDVNAAKNILSAGLAILAGADALRLHEKSTAGHAGA
ncbi:MULTISPECIES: IS200/IS605 family element RNA-guided endonuclease TnpB [unclassified Methylocaldum]|jgi:putative transposase|uniref:IS200/IS605 family element RNA-guided endonuclease TnpB n=1 Tax=unclassified Methylocaldum TaxID=2622260 RepID=UPI0012EBF1EE|nr:IS200/IS605 family element RNA-guided endonuclease TnpB [Methylocaldum sp. RMAD-M]MBP1152654.1 putative transposase [Methylocaldum sp. RMAD-M]MVF24538.1 transposase [Methylocaldum sp. BRCS4]